MDIYNECWSVNGGGVATDFEIGCDKSTPIGIRFPRSERLRDSYGSDDAKVKRDIICFECLPYGAQKRERAGEHHAMLFPPLGAGTSQGESAPVVSVTQSQPAHHPEWETCTVANDSCPPKVWAARRIFLLPGVEALLEMFVWAPVAKSSCLSRCALQTAGVGLRSEMQLSHSGYYDCQEDALIVAAASCGVQAPGKAQSQTFYEAGWQSDAAKSLSAWLPRALRQGLKSLHSSTVGPLP